MSIYGLGFVGVVLLGIGLIWFLAHLQDSVYDFMICSKCGSKKMTFVDHGNWRPHWKPELAKRDKQARYAHYACLGCDKDLYFPEDWFPPADVM